MTTPHPHCPVCHALASALTGTMYHAPHCPNGLDALAWAPSDVSPEDARTLHREGV